MKKRTLLLLIVVVCIALICVGCATENITPKESEKDAPNIAVEDNGIKEEPVEYELGSLEIAYEYYPKIPDENLVVLYANTYEECQALLDHEWIEKMKEMPDIPIIKERYEATTKYTEEFFEEKKLVILFWYEEIGGGDRDFKVKKFVRVTEEGKTPSYRITTRHDYGTGFGSDAEGFFGCVHAIEIDKSLDINSENLTVEVIDKTK